MKRILLIFTILITGFSFGQTDTSKVETYDLIQLTNGTYIKGKITTFDPSDGDIIFVDLRGKKYFLGKDDYISFEENIEFKNRRKKSGKADFVLRDRKASEFELGIGFSTPFTALNGTPNLSEERFLEFDEPYLPLCLNVGAGKYITRHHFIGANIDFGIGSSLKTYTSLNLRYAHQYDSHKKNLAMYIPIELSYNYMRDVFTMRVDEYDTTYYDNGFSASWPKRESHDIGFGSAGISLGHGFAYILSNKNSLAFELSYFRYFVLSRKYYNFDVEIPDMDFKSSGLKLNLKYNF